MTKRLLRLPGNVDGQPDPKRATMDRRRHKSSQPRAFELLDERPGCTLTLGRDRSLCHRSARGATVMLPRSMRSPTLVDRSWRARTTTPGEGIYSAAPSWGETYRRVLDLLDGSPRTTIRPVYRHMTEMVLRRLRNVPRLRSASRGSRRWLCSCSMTVATR